MLDKLLCDMSSSENKDMCKQNFNRDFSIVKQHGREVTTFSEKI